MSSKANIHADALVQSLSQRFGSTIAVAKAFDTDGQPLIKIGTQAAGAGSNSATLKLSTEPSIWKNSIGLAQEVYTPHRIQVAYEAVSATGVTPMTEAIKAKMMVEVFTQGMAVDIYVLATATAPTPANLATAVAAAAGPTVTIVPDISNPLTNQQ